MVKKKRSNNSHSEKSQNPSQEVAGESKTQEAAEPDSVVSTSTPARLAFKSRKYVTSKAGHSSKKSRGWKNLKQILAGEKLQPGIVSYASLDAPSSKKPSKRYSDLSGLPAKYKDPTTKLLYHNSDEFAQIKMLTPDVVTGYLDLRKAND